MINQIVHKQRYLSNFFSNESLAELERDFLPLLRERARRMRDGRNAVLISVVNQGHFDQFMNFLCALPDASAAKLHVQRHLIVFPVAARTEHVLKDLGIAVYRNERMFSLSSLTDSETKAYGDFQFSHLMWLKTIAVYAALHFGFDVLFQDVDVAWLRNPWQFIDEVEKSRKIEAKIYFFTYFLFFLKNEALAENDALFMTEMTCQHRFEPYYFNSGFFYLRATPGIRQAWEHLVWRVDSILGTAPPYCLLLLARSFISMYCVNFYAFPYIFFSLTPSLSPNCRRSLAASSFKSYFG